MIVRNLAEGAVSDSPTITVLKYCYSFGFDPLEIFLDFLYEFLFKFFKKFDYKNQTPLWNFDQENSKPFEISIGIQITLLISDYERQKTWA